jgi:hypothetical protein
MFSLFKFYIHSWFLRLRHPNSYCILSDEDNDEYPNIVICSVCEKNETKKF